MNSLPDTKGWREGSGSSHGPEISTHSLTDKFTFRYW
jgi:hypothetical protein